jgi:hypothetical protein
VRFGTDVLGQKIYTPDQQLVMNSVAVHDRTSVKSGHGVGKTNLAASLALWFLNCFTPSVVLTTAPTERQVKQLLWREIRARHRMALIPLPGRPLTMQLELSPLHYALGFSTNDANQLQGFHSPHILIIIDEANGYPAELYEPLESLLSGGAVIRFLQIGNPVLGHGNFFESFGDGETHNITLSCLNHPNVISGENIIPGAVTKKWVDRQERRWGKDSAFWESRVIGKFPSIATDLVISLNWVETAEQLKHRSKKFAKKDLYLGVDVGEYGNDQHSFYLGTTKRLVKLITNNGEPREAIGITKRIIREYGVPEENVSIDGIGVGAGIFSVLKETYPKIRRFVASETAVDSKSFTDKSTEAWWQLRDMLNPTSELYNNYSLVGRADKLKSDLCTRKYETNTKGQVMLEPKKAYRKRMKRSPDCADAMAIAYSPLCSANVYGIITIPGCSTDYF